MAWKQKYNDHLAKITTTYRDQLAGNRSELVQGGDGGTRSRYLPSADALGILSRLGGTLGNGAATGPDYWGPDLAFENITSQLDKATVIFGIENGIEPLTSNPLWKRLPAVIAGHVYLGNDLFPGGYSGGIALLDFLAGVCAKLNETN